jgi:2-succinyl-5-enolpyruvyl-6-hydroxy-3-cyclohexene-1-carboxylate synthase
LQLFEFDSSITLFCNRGTSGIDGSTSTAVGAAIVSELPTLLISGDLSFFYDANGLWNKYIPNNFKMIIINNDGGGIFRILPGNDNSKLFKTYFETKHGRSAEGLAKDFRFDYHTANSVESLSKALPVFFKASNSPQLLEVFTPSEDNSKILLAYFDALK